MHKLVLTVTKFNLFCIQNPPQSSYSIKLFIPHFLGSTNQLPSLISFLSTYMMYACTHEQAMHKQAMQCTQEHPRSTHSHTSHVPTTKQTLMHGSMRRSAHACCRTLPPHHAVPPTAASPPFYSLACRLCHLVACAFNIGVASAPPPAKLRQAATPWEPATLLFDVCPVLCPLRSLAGPKNKLELVAHVLVREAQAKLDPPKPITCKARLQIILFLEFN